MGEFKCPNCGQYKLTRDWPMTTSSGWSIIALACILAFLVPFLATFTALIGFGLVIGGWIYRMVNPPKSAWYSCSNCNYKNQHEL